MDQEMSSRETELRSQGSTTVERSHRGGMGNTGDIDPESLEKLDRKIGDFMTVLVKEDVFSDEFQSRVDSIQRMGMDSIRESASIAGRMLNRSLQSKQAGPFDETSEVSIGLTELRKSVEELDPGREKNLLEEKRLFGFIPIGNRLSSYFKQYQKAQPQLGKIIDMLLSGQDDLRRDNASYEQERNKLRMLTKKLKQYLYLATKLDEKVSGNLEAISGGDGEKNRVVREELLFSLRQKQQDLATQFAVTAQGYVALSIVKKNNQELIKGVDRATTTTLSALQTAVFVAQSLTNQKLVLDRIRGLQRMAGDSVTSTSQLLKESTGIIHSEAAGRAGEIEKLQSAFHKIYETMDEITEFKQQALHHMQQTVECLGEEVNKTKTVLEEEQADKRFMK